MDIISNDVSGRPDEIQQKFIILKIYKNIIKYFVLLLFLKYVIYFFL